MVSLSLSFREAFQQRRSSSELMAIAAAATLLLIMVLTSGGLAKNSQRPKQLQSTAAPLKPPPFLLRPVSPADALAINAHIPFSTHGNLAAKAFRFRGDDEARQRALECLTLAVYYEAGSEDRGAQEAVAQVVLNRVRHPAFPPSVCGVVFQGSERKTGCQFTFTCDASLLRRPDRLAWTASGEVAQAALRGAVFKPVGLATHYHANYVVPYWATSLEKNAQVGPHIFYRWRAAWGMPQAFTQNYSGREPDPAILSAASVEDAGQPDYDSIRPDTGIQFTVDPRLELLAVVQLLADERSDLAPADARYSRDMEDFFRLEKHHRAVHTFIRLSKNNANFAAVAAKALMNYTAPAELAPKPNAPGSSGNSAEADKNMREFIDALRDFAQASEFDRFFRGHKPFYGSVIRRTQRQAGMARARWQAYTSAPLAARTMVITSLATPSALSCGGRASTAVLSLGDLVHASDADIFLETEGAQSDSLFDEQMIRAVFARVTAQTQGDAVLRAYLSTEVRRGNSMVPTLERELRRKEGQADRVSTWDEFVRQLSGTARAGKAAGPCAANVAS